MSLKTIPILLVFLFMIFSAYGQSKQPSKVIFDTDMGPDYDDVGAIALLHSFADQGEIEILATIASTKYEGVAAVLNVLNTYFERPEVPIGVPKAKAIEQKDWQHWTDTLIAKYPHRIQKNKDAPDAVALYRKVLADQKDGSVTIITVGFLTNISNLLQSAPDEYSPLTGLELVKQKVVKLVSMAGKFPEGSEFNVNQDAPSSQFAIANWPKPLIYSGFEIGEQIHTGIPLITNKKIKNSPVKDAFSIAIPMADEDKNGRMSWDQTAVYVAALGHEKYFYLEQGKMIVADDGSNTWDKAGEGQFRLVGKQNMVEIEKEINKLMMHQPKKK
ncbi:nucleoside hydrolase [Algoriphagus chordae]|uniref:Inosine-uridine preferring nucleoside hydrolase n=1 Tax=Algoriphagus chordae TaxID=237019 RepID=A0A2W7RK32_9BACT|nr:nucleoside hydrolase [Algoriphagus chordae]PZX51015.1 inosine-uridine preferring nucleoside hydrolase [Algoriphagus chordae]